MKNYLSSFILLISIFLNVFCVLLAQDAYIPKIWIEVSENGNSVILFDKKDTSKSVTISNTENLINFHTSLYLGDSVINFVYDSLRYDSVATIMTVYETDEDSVVGVWEIGTGGNKQIWLNSQKVSYRNFGISYRRTTEKGVIINTMRFEYPKMDSNSIYTGTDTLFIGKQEENIGDKNFCEYLYFKGTLPYKEQRINETCLAVKYGALLHNGYIDRNLDTIWHSKGIDSLYSFGVCGVGRDDEFPILQNRSKVRKDLLTIETQDSLNNLDYIMLGHNEYYNQLSEETFFIDTTEFHFIERKWKLRSHSHSHNYNIKLIYEIPPYFNADNIRMIINTQDTDYNTNIVIPTLITDTNVVFDNILISDSIDYYISIAFEGDSIYNPIEEKKNLFVKKSQENNTENSINITLTPNPTNTGEFEVNVNQTNEDEITLIITNSKGQTIMSEEVKKKVKDYYYTNYISEQGVYFVTICSNGIKKTIKLVVIK